MRPELDPAQVIPFRRNGAGPLLLVKKYQRPAEWHGLYLPDSHREDPSWALWEVVATTDEANEEVGLVLHEGDIFKTRQQLPVDSGFDDRRDGRPLFFMPARAVQGILHTQEE